MKRIVIVLLVVVVAAAGAYAVFGSGREQAPPLGEQPAAVPGPVTAPDAVIADARVVPVQSAELSLPVGGIVAEVLVSEGERVEEGEVLLRLENVKQKAAVAQAEAQVQRSEAYLAQLRSGARPQEIESARAAVDAARAQLAKVRVGGPPLEVTIAEAEVRRAEAQLDLLLSGERPENIAVAEADLAAAKASLQQAKAALSETELRAPFAGVVGALTPSAGEFVAPGTPVVWLADDSAWLIETDDLTELGVVRVRPGSPAVISIDALPDLELTGRVAAIKPMGENRLGDIIYKVVIVPDQYDERLRWNMTASVTIEPGD